MAKKPRRRRTTSCPQCGSEFPQGRLACPHCGSDAQTGWRDGHDFGEFTEEDYDEVVADISGGDELASPKWRRRRRLLTVVGLVLVGLFVFWLLTVGSSGW